jgi:hypothetical protein
MKPDDWGFQAIVSVVPPRTNSEFESNGYTVTLTPSNHLVCKIMGGTFYDPNHEIFDGMRDALRKRYGNEDEKQTETDTDFKSLTWPFHHRSLNLTHENLMCTLMCEDEVLTSHPVHVTTTDTNGL